MESKYIIIRWFFTILNHLKNYFIPCNKDNSPTSFNLIGTRLEELNDDCLECIFQQLPTKDQYTLWLTTPHFKSIIELMWLRKFAKHRKLSFRDPKQDLDFGAHKNALVEFGRVICDSIEDLALSKTSQLLQLATLKWPKVRSLEALVQFHKDVALIDYNKQFPAVERIILLFKDNHLRNGFCIPFRIKFRQSLLKALISCDNLIELGVDNDMTSGILHLLKRNENCLQQLRKISDCYYYSFYEEQMLYDEKPFINRMLDTVREMEPYDDKMRTVGYNCTWDRRDDIIKAKQLKNLRRLNIICFSTKSLHLKQLPNLKELFFRCPQFKNSTLDMVNTDRFFRYAGNCVQTYESMQHYPLHIHCYVTEENWEIINDTISTGNQPEIVRITYVHSQSYFGKFPICPDASAEWDFSPYF